MGRIRHIKPGFFTHEKLNDLEGSHPHLRPMLVFSGLWCQADANGVFKWRPRTLKNEILPFVDYDMQKSLEVLTEAGFIRRFEHDGCDLGQVVNFLDHQHITAKEARYTNFGRKYRLPGESEETEADKVDVLEQIGDPGKNGNDLKLTGIPTQVEAVKEKLLGEIFIEQACVTNGFDKAKFTEYIKTWIANKILTETLTYPVNQLKRFVIEDYAKVIKASANGKSVKKRETPYVGL